MMLKKRNAIYFAVIIFGSFIFYQLYFFLALSAEITNFKIVDDSNVLEIIHVKTKHDEFINDHGVIRGVLRHNMPRYRQNKEVFKCFMVDKHIPIEFVNDNFCDCEDGSDEPSTNACKNGLFFCDTNRGKTSGYVSVPSSMVNDGICDCCDGSDEWMHGDSTVLTQNSRRQYRHYAKTCLNVCNE